MAKKKKKKKKKSGYGDRGGMFCYDLFCVWKQELSLGESFVKSGLWSRLQIVSLQEYLAKLPMVELLQLKVLQFLLHLIPIQPCGR